MKDSFGARSKLTVASDTFEIFRLDAVSEGHVDRLPYSLKILLENLLLPMMQWLQLFQPVERQMFRLLLS